MLLPIYQQAKQSQSSFVGVPTTISSLDDDVPYGCSIGLFLTRRCPIKCAHCLVGSAPENSDPEESAVVQFARSIAQSHRLQHVCITGGEPFLRLRLMKEILELLRTSNKLFSVVTSAFWATSVAHSKRLLQNVFERGLPYRLWVSIDSHHSEFVEAKKYSNLIWAAHELKIPVCLTATYSEDPEEAVAYIRSTIANDETLRLVSAIRPQPLFSIGRARQIVPTSMVGSSLPRGSCGSCQGHVDEGGNVTACCSVFDASRDNPLWLGNISGPDRGSSVDNLLEKASRNWLIQAIRTLGPARLAELANQVLPEELFRRLYLVHDICAVCSEVMASKEAVNFLYALLEQKDFRTRIANARLLLYGEPDSTFQLEEKLDE